MGWGGEEKEKKFINLEIENIRNENEKKTEKRERGNRKNRINNRISH